MHNFNFLNQVNIFSTLTKQEMPHVTKYLDSVNIKKGQILFKEGDKGNELFIVKKGSIISTIKLPNGEQKQIAQFLAGDFFGEMSIFENAPRSATCLAGQSSVLYKMHERHFFQVMETFPDIAIKIMYKMLNITTQRLRNTSKFLSDMVRWGNEASKRAITDELTGIYNRRFLDYTLKDYFQSALNIGKPLSLIMADLDYFREINNAYSQEIGNKVLTHVVAVFKKLLRKNDIIARYGGDEFTVILPETNLTQAEPLAQEICTQISKLDVLKDLDGPVTKITTSLGIASCPENTKDLQTLKKLADKALYQAKEEGRNQIYLTLHYHSS